MLVRLIYASRAKGAITEDKINSIFEQSKKNNLELGITGVLCVCHDEYFVQALEGGREEVNQLYATVVKDDRHVDVTLLDYEEISERNFSGWKMGRVNLNNVNAGVILRFSEKPKLDPYKISGRVMVKLLEELVRSSLIGGT